MAKLKMNMVTAMSGLLANEQFRTVNKEIIISTKPQPPTFLDPEDKTRRDARIKGFGGSSHLVPVVKDAIRLGLRATLRGQNLVSKFVELNATTLCTAVPDEETGKLVYLYDFPALQLSVGALDEPLVTATVDTEARSITFQQTGIIEEDYCSTNQPDDQLHAFVLAPDTSHGKLRERSPGRGRLVQLRDRGESGSTSFAIPASWDTTALHVYAFAVSADKKQASATACIHAGV